MRTARPAPQVLVVDDDITTSLLLQGILGRAGFRASTAADASEAVASMRKETPDLVLLDVHLPDANGMDLCRELHAIPGAAHVPVLFISSNEELSTKIRGFEAGGVDYIPKPFAGEEVLARVSTHLRLKHAYESLVELHAERIQRLAGAQETLMPSPADLPDANFEVALRQVLAAGGDLYDVVSSGGPIVDYLVADASGHDLSSSLWTAALKSLVGEFGTLANSPVEILTCLNRSLCRVLPQGIFFTLIYARLNRAAGRLTVATAGHPPALVARKTPSQEWVFLELEGDVLGAFPDANFGTVELSVRRGDRFFLYTDGLIECADSRPEGFRRLRESVSGHRQEPMATVTASVVETATRGRVLADDILLLCVEV